ncbi:MAG: hypothetical protein OWR62_13905 [Sulfobacillus thermotolerans]|nr:hypothetical protein [Sulfobacillus thermotolerans]
MEPPIDEAFLVAIRITELEQDPVRGAFDVAHLCEIHRRIFQEEVLARAFPRLTEARAMMTEDLVEYEAYVMLHRFRSYASLETLIRAWTARAPDRGVSKTRSSEPERD